jgi:hypothetical protein
MVTLPKTLRSFAVPTRLILVPYVLLRQNIVCGTHFLLEYVDHII